MHHWLLRRIACLAVLALFAATASATRWTIVVSGPHFSSHVLREIGAPGEVGAFLGALQAAGRMGPVQAPLVFPAPWTAVHYLSEADDTLYSLVYPSGGVMWPRAPRPYQTPANILRPFLLSESDVPYDLVLPDSMRLRLNQAIRAWAQGQSMRAALTRANLRRMRWSVRYYSDDDVFDSVRSFGDILAIPRNGRRPRRRLSIYGDQLARRLGSGHDAVLLIGAYLTAEELDVSFLSGGAHLVNLLLNDEAVRARSGELDRQRNWAVAVIPAQPRGPGVSLADLLPNPWTTSPPLPLAPSGQAAVPSVLPSPGRIDRRRVFSAAFDSGGSWSGRD